METIHEIQTKIVEYSVEGGFTDTSTESPFIMMLDLVYLSLGGRLPFSERGVKLQRGVGGSSSCSDPSNTF